MNRSRILIGLFAALVVAVTAFFVLRPAADETESAITQTTVAQHFTVSIAPEVADFQHNSLHAWIATVTSPDGAPVENARIDVDGGMPAHGHGLPTSPQMTRYLGDGRYKIEGVQFHMQGKWEFKLSITAGDISDSVTFELVF